MTTKTYKHNRVVSSDLREGFDSFVKSIVGIAKPLEEEKKQCRRLSLQSYFSSRVLEHDIPEPQRKQRRTTSLGDELGTCQAHTHDFSGIAHHHSSESAVNGEAPLVTQPVHSDRVASTITFPAVAEIEGEAVGVEKSKERMGCMRVEASSDIHACQTQEIEPLSITRPRPMRRMSAPYTFMSHSTDLLFEKPDTDNYNNLCLGSSFGTLIVDFPTSRK